MLIGADYLVEQKKALEAKRQAAVAVINQAAGAMAMIDAMLARLSEPESPAASAPSPDEPADT